MDAPLELQDEVLQLDARQFNYRVVHRYCTLVLGGLASYNEKIKFGKFLIFAKPQTYFDDFYYVGA